MYRSLKVHKDFCGTIEYGWLAFFQSFLKGSMELTANHKIQQIVNAVSDFKKHAKLIKHLDPISAENAKVLIFVGMKWVADNITKYLCQDSWLAIHEDKEQCVLRQIICSCVV